MAETLLFSDNFNRADTASGLGPDWEVTRGVGGQILGNRVAHGPSNGQGDRVDPTLHPFPADQWAEYTVVGGGFTWAGIGVRVQANASGEQKGYFFWYNGAQRIIAWHRVGSSGEQTLASVADSSQFSAGDVIRLSAVDEYTGETFDGVRLRAYINGVEVMTALDTHAGAWRSGQPGWNCWGGGTGRGFDDFSSGSFTTGYNLPVTSAYLSITGSTQSVEHHRALPTAQAHLTISRGDVNFQSSRSLKIDPGLFRIYLAGVERILPIRSGKLDIFNSDATLTAVRQTTLPVDRANLTITGGAVNLTTVNVFPLPVSSGNLSINRGDLVTRADRALPVTSANFGINRQNVVVDRDRRLQMDAGHFQILRNNFFLRYSGAPQPVGPSGVVKPVIRDYNVLPLIRNAI